MISGVYKLIINRSFTDHDLVPLLYAKVTFRINILIPVKSHKILFMDEGITKDGLIQSLTELAMDLHWSWNHATDKIWRYLDPELWSLTHNPLVVLQTVSKDRIASVLEDPVLQDIITELATSRRESSIAPAWYQRSFPNTSLTGVAFFSMEYMLSEALPIYSGGLGNVAGDLLKTASDLGVPVTGIGLLYQQGYTRQVIHKDGSQQYVSPYNDPGQLPITPVRYRNGEWIRIELKLTGYSLWLRTWKVQVGRTTLLLLDTNDPANFPVHRSITGELYGGGADMRLVQEMILGLGGCRLLKALDMHPEVYHLNEGHSAFAIVERAYQFMLDNDVSFETALQVTRSGNIFTTHTAVGAGFEQFPPKLIEQYLGFYITERLKLTVKEFMAFGRKDPADEKESFNTGYLAIKGSGFVNGVSALHGAVSRQLFSPLFPRWPLNEVPVKHVTNGVHMPTWDSPEADSLWTEACGKDRWLGNQENLEQAVRNIQPDHLWSLRLAGKNSFISYLRNRYRWQLATLGSSNQECEACSRLFEAEYLTIGFARRFAGYKRLDLLLLYPERLIRILKNKEQPVQLVIAGKAHPADKEGQRIIRDWIRFISEHRLQDQIVFLSDYDMLLTEQLVQGIDLWINMPRRPWEACGTSGMKVLVNGGINLSELDGWWDEAYSPEVGWTFGDRKVYESPMLNDHIEAERLFNLLEHEIIPEFYNRNAEGLPVAWVNRMRESMARLTPRFSANRCLREYTADYYLPAASAYLSRAAEGGKKGKEMVQYLKELDEKWNKIGFGSLNVEIKNEQVGFSVPLYPGKLNPDEFRVELYAEQKDDKAVERHVMQYEGKQPGNDEVSLFHVIIKTDRPAPDYTPRIIPLIENVNVPLEFNRILWQR